MGFRILFHDLPAVGNRLGLRQMPCYDYPCRCAVIEMILGEDGSIVIQVQEVLAAYQ